MLKVFKRLTAMMIIAAMLLGATGALAQQDAFISETFSMSQVAELAKIVGENDFVTDEASAESATVISAVFSPDEETAPEMLTVLVIGSQAAERVELTKQNGYKQTVSLTPSDIGYNYMLMDELAYTYAQSGNAVRFNITLEQLQEEALLPDTFIMDVLMDAQAGSLVYGDKLSLRLAMEWDNEMPYRIDWEYNDGSGWKQLSGEHGTALSFVLDEINSAWYVRAKAVLTE